jgi:hypothetical protein
MIRACRNVWIEKVVSGGVPPDKSRDPGYNASSWEADGEE